MNILTAEGISKSYSEKILFDDISLGISEAEKIGLIGVNGTGKSTLLKVIAGVESLDSGRIISSSSLKIEYLDQNPDFQEGTSVLEHVFKGNSPLMRLIREYEQVLDRFNVKQDERLEKELASIMDRMDSMDAWTAETEAKNILTQLGIFDFNAEVSKLSGGQRKRVAMAGALIAPSDLLILDEPTNHIDNETVDWLEQYLGRRKGALLMVTHDRYFLDRVSNRIIELDQGKLYSYQANYTKYLELKAEREEMQIASERKRQSLLRTEMEWMMRGARARSTKQKARIERFEMLKDQKPDDAKGSVEIKLGAARLGKKIIELSGISKSFPCGVVIKDLDYMVSRDDRLGIIGPNGSGKSTLLKIASGRLIPDKGTVSTGETVKIGYFSQENEDIQGDIRVIEYIRNEAEYLDTEDGVVTASQMLERFLFPPQVQWTPVSKLSGGERRRLYLLKILMGAPNVLMLDEPTNDLDIETLTILEGYLDGFPGAVLAVSHDRYFLDRVTEKLFYFAGNGKIEKFTGGYSDNLETLQRYIEERKNHPKPAVDKALQSEEKKKDKTLKFTYKEQMEFLQIDTVIEKLEGELKENETQLTLHASDFQKLEELMKKKQQFEKSLDESMERWTYLNELAEEIERNKKGAE